MVSGAVVHFETDISSGDLEVNDAYDLKLVSQSSGDYELQVFMKVQFFFKNSIGYIWTSLEKAKFLREWETEIKKAWGGRAIKMLSSGKRVFLNFEFKIQEGGWMFDHWEITVTKIKPGSFSTSYVIPKIGNVILDSEDLIPVNKGGTSPQRGAIHEFGHMLGLGDEYTNASPYKSDTDSIMHSSEIIRSRHDSTLMKWLNNTLAMKKIL